MADLTPNKRPDGQSPEDGGLEKSLESLSLDELLASVKDDLARVDAMMNDKDEAEQAKTQAEAELAQETQPQKQTPNMPPLFEPKIPEEYADLTVDQQPQEPEPAEEKKHGRLPSGIRVLLYVCCVLAASVLLAVFAWRCADDVLSLTKPDAEVTVTIADGATISQIAKELRDSGLVRSETLFKLYCWATHAERTIEPGTYSLNSRYDYHALVSNMVEASPDRSVVEITIPEGYECEDIFRLLEADGVCSYQDLADTAASYEFAYDFLQEIPYGSENRLEGYLFPDTYTFYQEMDVELVCQKILENFNSKITKEYYDRMEALNLTLDETITLASMIQAEAGSVDQMANISSVFWNRLNNSTEYPLLQSDPTTKYVEEVIKPHSETYDQALYDSYDTYKCTGLPAGPICNPGSEAIQAALYPANTGYYYFYSNIDTKQTYFAKTLEEHNANQQKVAAEQGLSTETGTDGEENEAETETSGDEEGDEQ